MSRHGPPLIPNARFIAEVREPGQFPEEGAAEVAIAGRSNVGKSTLLNRLTGRRALARTSKTPGRTRGLLFYDIEARWPHGGQTQLRLVDLPGYGYAQVSQQERKGWQVLVESYATGRQSLALFLVLVDARRALQAEEIQLLEWLATLDVRHRVVLTKVDKLSASERGGLAGQMRGALAPGAPSPVLISGQSGEGLDDLWRVIARAVGEARPAEANAMGLGPPDVPR